jgi:FkbM family methyltransferase
MSAQKVYEFRHGTRPIRLHLPNPEDAIQKRIAASGRFYELEMLEHAAHLLRPGDVALDVGANVGTHTVYLAAICSARVIAFEPNPEALAVLRENVRLNELQDAVTVVDAGLGAGSARADLIVPDANNLGRCKLAAAAEGALTIRAYDDLGFDAAVKLVKIDVEGMELDVLRGMSRLIAAHQPALYVEVQDAAELGLVRSHLEGFGYDLIECFNFTPTYCFLPTTTAPQRFTAIMSRWDASLRARQRTPGDSLGADDRGQIADKLREALEQLRTNAQEAKRDEDRRQSAQGTDIEAALRPLQIQLNQIAARVEGLRQEVRRANQRGLLTRLANVVADPRKAWREICRRVAARGQPKAPASLENELVSVVMTTHDSAAFVEAAARSILAQNHKRLELVVVDDASADGTVAILSRLQAEDPRVRVLRCYGNRGTYWAKNLGLMHARGKYATTQDSDDTSTPDRIERQLAALAGSPGALAATCNYVRVDAAGNVVLNRGLKERLGLITLLFDREAVLGSVGHFDSVRTSADAEFLERLRKRFGRAAIAHVDAPLYVARVRPDSLSANSVDLSAGDGAKPFLSEARAKYASAYEAWHRSDPEPRVPFPLRRRPFEAPPSLLRGCDWGEDRITASLASIPSRRDSLMRVVRSIVEQVDKLNVYLNNYDETPDFLRHPRIHVARSQDHGDIRDNGKFFFLADTQPGYCLTVDDDIVYPADYVARLVAKVKQYGHQAIVGFHGTILPERIERFFAPNGRTVLSFKHDLPEDRQVHVLGTGTTAWHTSTMRLALADFPSTGMADLWLAAKAQRLGVPMIAVARAKGYLAPMREDDANTLFAEFAHNDERQTALARSLEPWRMPPLREPGATST